MTSLMLLFQQLDVIIEYFEQLEENGNVVHGVCRAQMMWFDYKPHRQFNKIS